MVGIPGWKRTDTGAGNLLTSRTRKGFVFLLGKNASSANHQPSMDGPANSCIPFVNVFECAGVLASVDKLIIVTSYGSIVTYELT